VAIAALVLWVGTATVGSYLLMTAIRSANAGSAPSESASARAEQPATVSAEQPVAPSPAAAPTRPVRDRDRFDPPSLQRAKSEPLPGMRELAEFAHPALAIIGLGCWLGYALSHERVFAAIGLGLLLGAILAGVSWFTVSTRAAKRAGADGTGTENSGAAPLSFSPRLLTLHAIGAALTLLFVALIAARS
jgi:hypothetical protein